MTHMLLDMDGLLPRCLHSEKPHPALPWNYFDRTTSHYKHFTTANTTITSHLNNDGLHKH